MFEDEAGFGRISLPRKCWAPARHRPEVPSHHIREMRYAFGAVSPHNGEHYFLVMPRCDTACMNLFLAELSANYPKNFIVLLCDNAIWHRSKSLKVPENIRIEYILPYTPEMNPIEQIWGVMRREGFVNRVFDSLEKVVDQLCATVKWLTNDLVKSTCHQSWLRSPD